MILIKIIRMVKFLHFRSNPGVWIGAFMRTSTNEIMNFRCHLLHHEVNLLLPTEDILCLYYDFLEGKVLADTCISKKPFLCMNPKFGKKPICSYLVCCNHVAYVRYTYEKDK